MGARSAVSKENAAGALYNLAANADNQVAIAKEQGALAALALLRDGSAVGKETARRARCRHPVTFCRHFLAGAGSRA
jgi:hypothetical protein